MSVLYEEFVAKYKGKYFLDNDFKKFENLDQIHKDYWLNEASWASYPNCSHCDYCDDECFDHVLICGNFCNYCDNRICKKCSYEKDCPYGIKD